MKVLHIITSLGTGGAETMLRNLLLGLDGQRYSSRVISLTGKESIGAELEAKGIPVLALEGRGGLLFPHHLGRARRLIREWQPDVIHAWMYHANVVAQLLLAVTPRERRPRLVVSVRGALNAPHAQKVMLRFVRRLDSYWSSRADVIVFNSKVSARQHVEIGYEEAKVAIVPNGFDTNRFAPRSETRHRIRSELGIGEQILIGLIARFDVLKGHELFLRAAASLASEPANCVFVLAGRGCDHANRGLRSWIEELGLTSKVRLLGERQDIPELLNGLDVAVSSSISESFPNSIGEAMACGVPCIVTDVGDCAHLVGDAGIVVPPSDPLQLATAIAGVANASPESRAVMGSRGRRRILAHFSLEMVIRQFTDLYDAPARNSSGRPFSGQ